MAFSAKECAWSQTSIQMLGRKIEGLKGFEFNKEIEKELLYAAGQKPIDITEGNEKVDGSITVLKHEMDMLTDAAQTAGYDDLIKVPYTLILITCAFKLNPTSPIRIIEVSGVSFTKWSVGQQHNAKFTDVPLPFIAMGAQLRKG
jgi:hypothetical protein